MKTITVRMSEWGPNWLLDAATQKMCCLGFASEQCGVPRPLLENCEMPIHVDPPDWVPPQEFIELRRALQQPCPEELLLAARGINPDVSVVANLGQALASVNDYYHDNRARNAFELAVKAFLTAGFAHMGYKLEFVS